MIWYLEPLYHSMNKLMHLQHLICLIVNNPRSLCRCQCDQGPRAVFSRLHLDQVQCTPFLRKALRSVSAAPQLQSPETWIFTCRKTQENHPDNFKRCRKQNIFVAKPFYDFCVRRVVSQEISSASISSNRSAFSDAKLTPVKWQDDLQTFNSKSRYSNLKSPPHCQFRDANVSRDLITAKKILKTMCRVTEHS